MCVFPKEKTLIHKMKKKPENMSYKDLGNPLLLSRFQTLVAKRLKNNNETRGQASIWIQEHIADRSVSQLVSQ